MKNTLTAGELIALLQDYPADTPVAYGYNYGDYWNTVIAGAITDAEERTVEYSESYCAHTVTEDEYPEAPNITLILC